MGILDFINNNFFKPRWSSSPEKFLAFILFLQKENNPIYSKSEVLQWAEILRKIFKINLYPYKDFEDLLSSGIPDQVFIDELKASVEETKKRIELKKAIYGEDIDLGDDDIMTSNSDLAIRARKTVVEMSKYIQFAKEEGDDKI